MNEKDKPTQEVWFKFPKNFNLTEFYNEINEAIQQRNLQSVYQLSKIFARYHFRKTDN